MQPWAEIKPRLQRSMDNRIALFILLLINIVRLKLTLSKNKSPKISDLHGFRTVSFFERGTFFFENALDGFVITHTKQPKLNHTFHSWIFTGFVC